MSATADVILSINSKLGPGGLASLQAGIGMLNRMGRAVIANVKELDEFSQVYRRVEIDISKADLATKGLVDTLALMKNANKFTAAQMEITGEQFRSVAVLAADMAKKMGTSVTSEMNALTDAITRGSTRALKRYGLDLENTEDLLLAQAEAMEKVGKAAEGVTIEIETLSEQVFLLGNNFGTSAGLTWDWIKGQKSGDGILGDLNEGFALFNEEMMRTEGGVADVITSADGLTLSINGLALEALQSIGIFGDWTEELNENAQAMSRLAAAAEEAAKARKELAKLDKTLGEVKDLAGGATSDREAIQEMLRQIEAGTYKAPTEQKKKRRGGGGRKRGRQDSELDEIDFLTDRDLFTETETGLEGLGFGSAGILAEDPFLASRTPGEMSEQEEHASVMLEMEMQLYDARNKQIENEVDNADMFRSAWVDAFDGFSASALLAEQSVNALRQASMSATQAAIFGGKSIKEAAFESLSAIAAQVAGESVFQALRETAAGFGAYARRDFEAASEHWTSAGIWTATGVAAGLAARGFNKASGGGGSAASGGGLNPSGSGFTSGGVPGGPSQGNNNGVTEVTINLTGGIEGFLSASIDENDKRKRLGEPSL